MDNLLISFFSLCKNGNNGNFKSEKQASFLLSKCDNFVYTGTMTGSSSFVSRSGNYGANTSQQDVIVQCDNQGVISITKINKTTGKTEKHFARLTVEQLTAKKEAQEKEDSELLARQEIIKQEARKEEMKTNRAKRLFRIARKLNKLDDARLTSFDAVWNNKYVERFGNE